MARLNEFRGGGGAERTEYHARVARETVVQDAAASAAARASPASSVGGQTPAR